MKLLLIFTAVLAYSMAEEEMKKEVLEDSEAEASASIELLKEGADLNVAASSYNTYVPPSQRYWNPPQNTWVPPQTTLSPPQNTWGQPQNTWGQPQNTWVPPKQETVKPIQPINTGVPANTQNYYDHHHHNHPNPQWSTPIYHPPTTTTPVSVIKNEQIIGDNGYYKYEYQLADGTHVGEEGYYTDPNKTEESLVKKGWYSFVALDGKTYTTTYWADKTGFHAFGNHLPTPPPVPAAIQAALDKQAEAEKYKPQYDAYPTQTPAPVYYPTQAPSYVPPQQPTYAPPQQPTYQVAQIPTFNPQTFYPSQHTYYAQQPQQPSNYV